MPNNKLMRDEVRFLHKRTCSDKTHGNPCINVLIALPTVTFGPSKLFTRRSRM